MSKLLVEPLITSLEQEFSFKLEGRCLLASVAPYLYMHNSPAGSFYFSVYKGEELVFIKTFSSAQIKAALSSSDNFARVYYPMIPSNPVFFTKGTYRATLEATGYSFNSDSFLGWVREHENTQDEMDYVPAADNHNPLAMRRKIYKQGIIK